MPDLIQQALKDRPDVNLLQINEDSYQVSRKAVRNAMLPQVALTGYYAGYGLGGLPNPNFPGGAPAVNTPAGFGGTLQNTFNNSSPDYLAEIQINVPLRNRQARADQFRSELEYRQAQLQVVQQKKNLRIEVRNAAYSLEQGGARVEAARKARDLAQRTFDIKKQEQQLGAGSNFETLTAEHDLAIASSTLAAAETAYEKYRVELVPDNWTDSQPPGHLARRCALRRSEQAGFLCATVLAGSSSSCNALAAPAFATAALDITAPDTAARNTAAIE